MIPQTPTAIVLGGTNPHVALLKNLRNRGYRTILVDYYETPPGKKFADEHIRESTLDMDAVVRIAKANNATLVISACVDQANVTACYAAEQLGLPAPYSYNQALSVSNKIKMKEIFHSNNIPSSSFKKIESMEELNTLDLRFPLVVKPADSTGSKGVKKADDTAGLYANAKAAFEISRSGEVIIEEFFAGQEISVDCYIQEGIAHIIMLRGKYNIIDSKNSVIQCFASIAPFKVSDSIRSKISKIADSIAKAFELKNTSLLLQVLVNKEEEVSVIEFAPRVGGGLSFRTVLLNTGFDILDATIESYLGNSVQINVKSGKSTYATNNVYAKPGKYGDTLNIESLKASGTIEEYYEHKTNGMTIGDELSSRDRVGSFISKADSQSELLRKIETAINTLIIRCPNGEDITRRDIFIRELN